MAIQSLTQESRRFLIDRGLDESRPRSFEGNVNCGPEYGDVPIRLEITEHFPLELPAVYVDRENLPIIIPHHEKDGKLCLFPNTGTVIDVTNPVGILRETLERTERVLFEGLTGKNHSDFAEEFTAYWKGKFTFRSICDPFDSSREVVLAKLSNEDRSYHLFADSHQAVQDWASKLDQKIVGEERAFLVRFKESFAPPAIWLPITNADLVAMVREFGENNAEDELRLWLTHKKLPKFCVLSMPAVAEHQSTLVAIKLEPPETKAVSGMGIRKNEGAKQLIQFPDTTDTRIAIKRLDTPFVIGRGGSTLDLSTKTVALVGCGSVGSRLSEKLASVGIGTMYVIDPEDFGEENLGRHILGIGSLEKNKAKEVCKLLDTRFPLQTHIPVSKSIREVLLTNPELLQVDLLIISIGDETVQMDLDSKIPAETARLHVWLEPLGLGGHLVSIVNNNGGCYNCLFRVDSKFGIVNQLAFCEPGQLLQRSHSGCAGVFTPFSVLDADRAANEAAVEAVDILLGRNTENRTISWLLRRDLFESVGLKVTQKADSFSDGERKIQIDFVNQNCNFCNIKCDSHVLTAAS